MVRAKWLWEDAKRLKEIVLADPRNAEYGNMLASAIIKNYVDFLSLYKTKIVKGGSGSLSSLSIEPVGVLDVSSSDC